MSGTRFLNAFFMGKINKIAATVEEIGQSLASLVKVALQSRRPSVRPSAALGDELVVLGNGPSLNDTVALHADFLHGRRLLAVNFAANTPLFQSLKPDYYVLADPHFFNPQGNPAVASLWDALAGASWTITLMVPVRAVVPAAVAANPNVSIQRYNLTPVEGLRWLSHALYRAGLGMPRPRNVLIPSLMLAIAAGFKTIYVAGADHSWMKTISVDDDNHVVSVQPHFYKDSDNEHARVRKDYMNYPLHQIVYSFYVAFRSYHALQRYAKSVGVSIFNITPGSFIDAFPRKKL